jgi:hypothetical protein
MDDNNFKRKWIIAFGVGLAGLLGGGVIFKIGTQLSSVWLVAAIAQIGMIIAGFSGVYLLACLIGFIFSFIGRSHK